tara:strand:- start:650 stop:913 length:264 start_codon:yes stop_codon:yes gene_type:complete
MTKDSIQKFIDEDINPALEMHGGFISIYDFDENTKILKLEMGGGCQGCASSRITLNVQVKNFLKEEFPDLLEIKDVTDHNAGINPYY